MFGCEYDNDLQILTKVLHIRLKAEKLPFSYYERLESFNITVVISFFTSETTKRQLNCAKTLNKMIWKIKKFLSQTFQNYLKDSFRTSKSAQTVCKRQTHKSVKKNVLKLPPPEVKGYFIRNP